MIGRVALPAVLFALLVLCAGAFAPAATSDTAMIARGKYLVAFGGCNDCHTPGWRESFGNVPMSGWMIGSTTGFRGPWGTVYPANVRKRFFEISEADWLFTIRTREGRPPAVWHDLRTLTTYDQRAIYRFIRSLGNGGPPSMPDVPPDKTPRTQYYILVHPK